MARILAVIKGVVPPLVNSPPVSIAYQSLLLILAAARAVCVPVKLVEYVVANCIIPELLTDNTARGNVLFVMVLEPINGVTIPDIDNNVLSLLKLKYPAEVPVP